MGLWPIAGWDCGFESRPGYGYLSVVSVVFCQVQVSVTDLLLVQGSPTECDVSEYDLETSKRKRPRLTRAVEPHLLNYLLHGAESLRSQPASS